MSRAFRPVGPLQVHEDRLRVEGRPAREEVRDPEALSTLPVPTPDPHSLPIPSCLERSNRSVIHTHPETCSREPRSPS